MGKASKSTKKFQKSHLKRTVDQRNIEQKYKKKVLGNKKAYNAGSRNEKPGKKESTVEESFLDGVSAKEFFKEGFSLPVDVSESSVKNSSSKSLVEELAENDPKFYKYLQENDKELLDFNVDVSDTQSDASSDYDTINEENQEPLPKSLGNGLNGNQVDLAKKGDGVIEVSMKHIESWEKALVEEVSLRTLKKVLQAFKSAVHFSESSGEALNFKYSVTDPDVFNALIVLTLTKAPEVIQHHVPLQRSHSGERVVSNENKKLNALSGILKSHAHSLTTLLSDIKDRDTVILVLRSIQELLPYFLSYRRLVKELINAAVGIWIQTDNDEARLAVIGFLTTAAEEYKKSLLESIIKSAYGGMIKISRNTSIYTMPQINFLKNSAVRLFEIDPNMSYQQGFQYIRQLAIHLRSSIVDKTKDSHKAVYNWQFVHSLDFWSRVLCNQCSPVNKGSSPNQTMDGLIYPLVQVTLGTIRLIPTVQYFPLRFYLCRSLLRLSQQTGVFIPLLPVLSEIFSSSTITKKVRPAIKSKSENNSETTALKALDFDHNIRASKSYIGSKVYQDGVCEQLLDLTSEFFVLHCQSIAFPELATPAIISFRRFLKKSHHREFSSELKRLVDKLDENSKFILRRRGSITFSPSDKSEVASFMSEISFHDTPLGEYVEVRRKIKEDLAKTLRESIEERHSQIDNNNKSNHVDFSDEDIGIDDLEDQIRNSDDDGMDSSD